LPTPPTWTPASAGISVVECGGQRADLELTIGDTERKIARGVPGGHHACAGHSLATREGRHVGPTSACGARREPLPGDRVAGLVMRKHGGERTPTPAAAPARQRRLDEQRRRWRRRRRLLEQRRRRRDARRRR